MSRFKVHLQIVVVTGFLLLAYTNCGQNFSSLNGGSTDASSTNAQGVGGLCEDQLLALFDRGYHTFLEQNCTLCHSTGPGKGQFANPNLEVAWKDFNQVGYEKISLNATSSNHNPPASGPQHIQTINELRLEWQKGQIEYNKCKGIAGPVDTAKIENIVTLETSLKKVPAMNFGSEQKIIWDLTNDLSIIGGRISQLPNIPGAQFSILVGKNKTSGGETYYTFRRPTLFGSSVDVHVKGVHVKINGRLQTYPTTFRYVDVGIRAGSQDDLSGMISTGSLVVPGVIFAEDQVSLVFELIERTSIGAPPAPVTVNFSASRVRNVNEVGPSGAIAPRKFLDIDVVLSQGAPQPITVSVSDDTGPICGQSGTATLNTSNCLPSVTASICPSGGCTAGTYQFVRAQSVVGPSYNQFNWDYQFVASTLTFAEGETKKTIIVEISTDLRKETNRLLTLQLNSTLGGAQLGTSSTLHVPLVKFTNPAATVGVPRFSELMNPSSGILGVNCVKCHNSVKREGGYDMTNYSEMVVKGVLVPGSTTSKMYRRMNANDPNLGNLTPMPLDGFLEESLIRPVERWIQDGAKNN